MALQFLRTALSDAAFAAQQESYGRSLRLPARREGEPAADRLGDDEASFIAARDSFYLATVTPDGWPYIQHRGGPPGFLRVLSPSELAFADLGGNRQLISTGNVGRDGRVALFLMDYPRRERLKILARARIVRPTDDQELVAQVLPEGASAKDVERVFRLEVVGFDWNCPKYITPRFTVADIEVAAGSLQERIAQLEAEVARLRSGGASAASPA